MQVQLLVAIIVNKAIMDKIGNKKELFSLLGIVLLAAFLRLYALDIYPAGFHGDEAWTGLEARRILTEGTIGVWSIAANGQPALPFYWTAFIFSLFDSTIATTRL